MFGVSIKEVQSYVDKKFDAFTKAYGVVILNNGKSMAGQIKSLQSQLDTQKARMKQLTEYLGVEYSETCTKGFTKIKKTKKK